MLEEVKNKRGIPRKNPVVETNSHSSTTFEKTHEFNSYSDKMLYESIFKCGVYDYFTKDEIDAVLRNPIANHETAIRLSEFVYGKNGIVSNSIDYMTALMTLDRIITSKGSTKKAKQLKELMRSTLKTIDDKQFIRDALFTEMLDGIAFYYFEISEKKTDKSKYMYDYQVENIFEINELGINASIITLPWQYTKIVGKKNGRYVIVFNLKYFNDYTGEELDKKLRKYPKEIVQGYNNKERNGDWLVLNSDKTMCRKIKCKNVEPWGRSLIIAALSDVLYKDYFIDTKRNTLDEQNSKILYETFPEGKDKGSCALTGKQQQQQHDTVKGAIMNKNNQSGTSFFSVAAGTKLDKIDVNIDILDSKNESNLNDQIALDLGICASLIGAMSTGTFAGSTSNLEMITAQIYTWVCEWKNELVHVINKNIIKDAKNQVEIYYFPTSFVNRKAFFEMMKDLYNVGGSLTFLIASSGVDVDVYYSTMDNELENKIYDKYLPHLTSATISKDDNVGGRPKTDNPSDNTIKSQNNNGNDIPSPSDNK